MNVPGLPLQVLLRRQPTWAAHPMAVLTSDRPHGRVLWVNDHARRRRVLPGTTFAAARTLAPSLRAATIEDRALEQAVGEIFAVLIGFSPRVEPAEVPGVFWIDPDGTEALFGGFESWAEGIRRALIARGFETSVVVGFHRQRTRLLARAHSTVLVVPDPAIEGKLAARVRLDHLDLSPELRDGLALLDVHTVGRLLSLPIAELTPRFGLEAARLHRALADAVWDPMQPRPLVEPVRAVVDFEPAEQDLARVLFRVKSSLHATFASLAQRGQALTTLELRLELDHAAAHQVRLSPARPTLDAMQVLELVRLRLDRLQLAAPIASIVMELEGRRATGEQLALFRSVARRDPLAAARALARVRAAWGDEAVVGAELVPAHLPEAGFAFRPLECPRFPRAEGAGPAIPPLVRRLFSRPVALPSPHRHEPEGWLDRPLGVGAVLRMWGPFRISGGWWARTVERDYYWAETQRGDLLWLYWDRPRRQWFWHGTAD